MHITLYGQNIQFEEFSYETLGIEAPTDLLWIENDLYISTFFGGFHKFKNGDISFSNETFESGTFDKNIRKMTKFNDKIISLYQFLTNSRLYQYSIENDEFELLFDEDEYELNNQTSDQLHCEPRKIAANDEFIVCGTTCGLLIYNFEDGLTQIKDYNNDDLIDIISDLKSFENEFYFSTTTSIYQLDIPTFEVTEIYSTPDESYIGRILPTNEGILFTNSDNEIRKISNNQVTTIAAAPESVAIYPTGSLVKESDTILLTTIEHLHLIVEGEYISNLEVCGFNRPMIYGALADNCNLNLVTIEKTTNLNNLIKGDDFTFYPNPSSNILNLELHNSVKNNIQLYNGNGELLFSKQLNVSQNTLQITTNKLIPGIYFLRINNNIEKVSIIRN